ALSNPLTTAATISFTFTNVDGSEAAHGVFNLDAGKQKSVFINEAPFRIDDFEGALTLESTSPIAVVALRGLLNEQAEFLITTLPGCFRPARRAASLVLPHFAGGGGGTTDFLLVNVSDGEQSGTLRLSNGAGQLLETVR